MRSAACSLSDDAPSGSYGLVDLDAFELRRHLGEEAGSIAASTAGSSVPCGEVNTICAVEPSIVRSPPAESASWTSFDSLSGRVKSVW